MPFRHLDLSHYKFRADADQDPDNGFDRAQQLRLCAGQLEYLRREWAAEWSDLCAGQASAPAGLAEFKKQVKQHIHQASESVDVHTTVDFITRGVRERLNHLSSRHRNQKSLLSHLTNSEFFVHEHMVPTEAAFSVLTNPALSFYTRPFAETLGQLCFRALVTKRPKGVLSEEKFDIERLDSPQYRQGLPDPAELLRRPGLTLEEVPLEFYGLMRYEAAGLYDELIPARPRAADTLLRYAAYRSRPLPTAATRAQAGCAAA